MGTPGTYAGANTESWHTIQLWRHMGWQVNVIPTWSIDPWWKRKLENLGCTVHEVPGPDVILDVPDIQESIVVGMCNDQFLKCSQNLRTKGRCKLVWLNCMCWIFDEEIKHYSAFGPFHRYIFQSKYQESCLLPMLQRCGVQQKHTDVIHGPFYRDEWPFNPRSHAPDTEFYIGRLSREDADKFSSNSWRIYNSIPYPNVRMRIMGWNPEIEKKIGPKPANAEVLPPNASSPQAFVGSLHAYMQINGGAKENWPRVGLEAMATGCPLIVQDDWGWREMVDHGKTGYLCRNDYELAYYAARLAYDEDLRMTMAQKGLERLNRLASPEVLGAQWRRLLEGL